MVTSGYHDLYLSRSLISAISITGSLYYGAGQTLPVSLSCGLFSGVLSHLYPENTQKIVSAIVGPSIAIGMNRYYGPNCSHSQAALSIAVAGSAAFITNCMPACSLENEKQYDMKEWQQIDEGDSQCAAKKS